MRNEKEIFAYLLSLCTSPGYIHAIAYFCFRDNTISVDGSDEQNVEDRFNRLIRNEISTLLGLMMKEEIHYKLPSLDVLQSYIDKTELLLKELHQLMAPSLQDTSNKKMLREAIFYGPESAYQFQYRDIATIKYNSDNSMD